MHPVLGSASASRASAPTARQRHEGIARRGHPRLALMHVTDHDQIGEPRVGDLVRQHAARHDSGHRAAGGQRPVRDGPHETGARTAVDQPQARSGHCAAEVGGGAQMCGVAAGGGTAEDGHGGHAGQVHRPYPLVRT
ncbi:hypothetical protein ADK35_40195 [Streptomyces viridochromogenes]|nr:hypothetical protein ADK35_40195 [Streptomyces viridochromogenes]KOG27299.1 hypothetical protein ADK36_01760 [Streptomyces viridochromogenes]